MKYIKKFNEQEKSIEEWCRSLKLHSNRLLINADNTVDVFDDVKLYADNFNILPIKFGKVHSFDCRECNLVSLIGSPIYVWGTMNCSSNELETLEGCPEKVGRDFYCTHNGLTSLKGCVEKITYVFDCSNNNLTSLLYGPKIVRLDYNCYHNELTSLDGSPMEVEKFNCSYNELITLKGSPKKVNDNFSCNANKLISFDGGPEKIKKYMFCRDNPVFELFKLFSGDYEEFKASVDDYKYLRGTNIVRRRFESACVNARIEIPDIIPGYEFI
jgi:hypothetical protein